MKPRVTKWLIFSVVLSLLPLVFGYFHKAMLQKASDPWPTLAGTVAHGEILLISVALAADALGDILESNIRRVSLRLGIGGACLICIVTASLYFADISVRNETDLNQNVVLGISLVVFCATLLSTGISKIFVRG